MACHFAARPPRIGAGSRAWFFPSPHGDGTSWGFLCMYAFQIWHASALSLQKKVFVFGRFPWAPGRLSYTPGPSLGSVFLWRCFCRQKSSCRFVFRYEAEFGFNMVHILESGTQQLGAVMVGGFGLALSCLTYPLPPPLPSPPPG